MGLTSSCGTAGRTSSGLARQMTASGTFETCAEDVSGPLSEQERSCREYRWQTGSAEADMSLRIRVTNVLEGLRAAGE